MQANPSYIGTNLTDLEGDWGEMRVSVSDTDIVIHFPFNEEANAHIKAIEGSEYLSADKAWSLPITEENWRTVREAVEFVRDAIAREERRAEHQARMRVEMAEMVHARLDRDFGGGKISLGYNEGDITVSFPYSAKAVAIMRKVEGRRWDGEEKAWLLPADQEKKIRSALKALKKHL